jgi:hypothetical protein
LFLPRRHVEQSGGETTRVPSSSVRSCLAIYADFVDREKSPQEIADYGFSIRRVDLDQVPIGWTWDQDEVG